MSAFEKLSEAMAREGVYEIRRHKGIIAPDTFSVVLDNFSRGQGSTPREAVDDARRREVMRRKLLGEVA